MEFHNQFDQHEVRIISNDILCVTVTVANSMKSIRIECVCTRVAGEAKEMEYVATFVENHVVHRMCTVQDTLWYLGNDGIRMVATTRLHDDDGNIAMAHHTISYNVKSRVYFRSLHDTNAIKIVSRGKSLPIIYTAYAG